MIITGDGNGTLWNFQSEEITLFQNLLCCDFTPDGKYLISGNSNGELVQWCLSGKMAFNINVDYIDKVLSVSPEGEVVFLKNDTLYRYDESKDNKAHLLPKKDNIKRIAYSKDGKFEVLERENNRLYINTDKNETLSILDIPFNITEIGISPHGSFVWATGDSALSIYTIKGRMVLNNSRERFDQLNNVDFSDDEKYMTFAFDCCKIALYDTKGSLIRVFEEPKCSSKGAYRNWYAVSSFLPDEQSIITYFSFGGEFIHWTKGGQIKKTWYSSFRNYSLTTEFSPDGKYCLQGGYYEMDTKLYTFDGEELISYGCGGVYSITFSANNKYALLLTDYGCVLVHTPESYM